MLAALMLVDAALLLYMGRGLSFFYDDWDYVIHDYGGGLHSLLLAHNGHLSLFPVAIYKLLFHLVGLNHYAIFRIVLLLLHLTCAGLVFVLASRRLPRIEALLATALILFLGAAWEDLLWAFQISYMLSIAGGLAAWALLDRRDRLGDLGAMAAVAVSLGSSGLGIPVLIGVVVELVWQREWRRWFVVVIPAVLYALWYLHYGEDEITRNGLINSPGFAEDIAAAAFGGLAGRGLDWGRPLALLGVVGLLVQLVRRSPVSGRLAGLLATGVSLWALTAAARSTISTPETGRYIYLGAVVIVLIGAELMRRTVPESHGTNVRAQGLAVLVVALFVVTGLTLLHDGATGLRGTSKTVTAELGALELVGARAPYAYQPDPQRAPQVIAGPYLHTVRAIGSSPADSPTQIVESDPVSRSAADGVLIAVNAPAPVPLGQIRPSALAPAPAVVALAAGSQSRQAGCVLLTPLPGAAFTAALTLPSGGVAIYDRGATPGAVALRRFGEGFQPISAAVTAHHAAALTFPKDASAQPWQAQLSSASPLSVCGLLA
ncbi:MAG TPA: hypothetical protein VHW67_01385 [Solirubrobacteraceae bacterium]|nr:hypothetical protein [Solirubrobacteraceae bacterium]